MSDKARSRKPGRAMAAFLNRLFNGPWPATFAAMGLFGALFAFVSANLAIQLGANIAFIRENGWWGVMEGGGLQILELALLGYASLAFYVLFKGCLYGLLGRFQKH